MGRAGIQHPCETAVFDYRGSTGGSTARSRIAPIARLRRRRRVAWARRAAGTSRVVERTHSWLNRFRGLLVRWSKKPRNHRALLQLACGLIAWRLATAEDLPG